VLFPNLKAIVIPEAAVESFSAEAHLAQFRRLLKPVRNGDQVAERLRAVALPGHAPGHTGYAFDTDEDRFLFFGDIVHVPALQFGVKTKHTATSRPHDKRPDRRPGADRLCPRLYPRPGPRPAERIRGNTHMMMMDKNSDEIADVVQTWLTKHGLQ
jgi:glyoxylase-like metal-dependent hydrolase (beta-lactamase superfamily II)